MDALRNLDKLARDVTRKIVPYVHALLALHREHVVSVVVYGSATGCNYVPQVSDINLAFIVRYFDFEIFKDSLKIVSKGLPAKITAPLFLTRAYIESSLDIFPVEFLDIKENHVLIYGEDVFSTLEIKAEHLRLFCEQQVKGKLIRLQQAYLEVGLKKRVVKILLRNSLNSLIPIFRNLIRLKGQQPAIDKAEILKQLCQEFNLNTGAFLSLYKASRNDEKISSANAQMFFEKYIGSLQQLAKDLDQWRG